MTESRLMDESSTLPFTDCVIPSRGPGAVISFTCYCHPEPQGSAKGFPIRRPNGKIGAVITTDNKKLKPFRHALAQVALAEVVTSSGHPAPLVGKHIPVRVDITCYFQKPDSAPKKRLYPVVKPDKDKLERSVLDALTGILFVDDAQVVDGRTRKLYGTPERVEITLEVL